MAGTEQVNNPEVSSHPLISQWEILNTRFSSECELLPYTDKNFTYKKHVGPLEPLEGKLLFVPNQIPQPEVTQIRQFLNGKAPWFDPLGLSVRPESLRNVRVLIDGRVNQYDSKQYINDWWLGKDKPSGNHIRFVPAEAENQEPLDFHFAVKGTDQTYPFEVIEKYFIESVRRFERLAIDILKGIVSVPEAELADHIKASGLQAFIEDPNFPEYSEFIAQSPEDTPENWAAHAIASIMKNHGDEQAVKDFNFRRIGEFPFRKQISGLLLEEHVDAIKPTEYPLNPERKFIRKNRDMSQVVFDLTNMLDGPNGYELRESILDIKDRGIRNAVLNIVTNGISDKGIGVYKTMGSNVLPELWHLYTIFR